MQIQVQTRSVGTNTQEPGKANDAAHMGPCQPGTSVNLEGIVWHETEEGEFAFLIGSLAAPTFEKLWLKVQNHV